MNVWFANPNYRFGANAFLPYSAGRLWAYAKAQPDIAANWTLGGIVWQREPYADVIERMRAAPPDVLALSLYIWSERYCLALADVVQDVFPSCDVVVGGPQVPERDTYEWALNCSDAYITGVVLGEGETAFVEWLRSGLRGDRVEVIRGERITDLSTLPSPYLAGVFDELVEQNPDVQWQALQETNRGCPYQCTFCDWGSATYSKVRKLDVSVCERELVWFAANRIELLYNCDANFGMLEQDVQFTDALIECNRIYGYPKKFRAAYAKKINDRVFGVAKKISDAGLSKGATISFQSMDQQVLRNVKRLNPVESTLEETFKRYNDAGISTYTELIVGLPGETLESFYAGIDRLLDAGQHYGLAVYPCMALRNSALSSAESIREHGIVTREVDLLLLHGVPGDDPAPERYQLVIETKTMSMQDWRTAWQFAIVVQALHCSGILTQTAMRMRGQGVKYSDYYRGWICMANDDRFMQSPLTRALRWWDATLDRALNGGAWDTVIPKFGPVMWPPEEAVRLMVESEMIDEPDEGWETWARETVWYGRKGGVVQREKEAA